MSVPTPWGRKVAGLGALVAALCLVPQASWAEGPTLVTITPDGLLEDWATVRSNLENLTRDGDGASVPCAESTDRDCIVPSNSGDLDFLAWTFDADNLYLLVRRFDAASGNDAFFLHVDADRDGFVEASERIVRVRFNNSNSQLDLAVFQYDPANAAGDPIADGLGFSDGYVLPGDLGTSLVSGPSYNTGSGEIFEIPLAWADLGVAYPNPPFFHLGVDNACCSPASSEDNLGGPGGGPGDLGFLLHTLGPPRVGSYAPSAPIELQHSVVNTGNLPDRYRLRTFSSEGYDVELLEDTDGDTFPDIPLGLDARGDGDFTRSQDRLDVDADGDTFPETSVLAPGEAFHVILRVTATRGAKSFLERTTLETRSLSGDRLRTVEDLIAVGFLTLTPPRNLTTEPGTQVRFCHEITNHLETSTLMDFSWTSSQGWSYQLYADPNDDCDISDASPLVSDSNANGFPDLNIPASNVVTLVAVTDVPPGTALGTRDSFTLEADSDINNSLRSAVTDQVTIADLLNLAPAYRLADGSAKSGAPGRRLWFRHVLEYSGQDPDDFQLDVSVPGGHAALLYTDPNGDGFPLDGTLLGASGPSGSLEPLGGRFPFLVALDIDPNTAVGSQFDFQVSATSLTNGSLTRTVTNQVTVTRVAAYADPLFIAQESRFPLCSSIFAQSSGLVPGVQGRYRFQWYQDDGPVLLQETPFTSDADGTGQDTLVVDETFAVGDYSLVVQEFNGSVWVELDRDQFRIDDFGALDELRSDKAAYFLEGEDLGVTARFLNDGQGKLKDQVIRYAVLSPDRSLVLQDDGTFVAAAPDLWTHTSQPFSLAGGESETDGFTVADVVFPEGGTYILQAQGEGTCGNTVAVAETTFEVLDDSDGDGWRDDEELDRGTDPLDRDTDDDGLLDPVDGDGDADGDTVIDALECDSDADGLPDGLETGLVLSDLDPDTDVGAGCFVEDADAGATVTDRFLADSDGGGASDGQEDLNADGALDGGEKDPLDASDDPCAWTPPPEVGALRLQRSGSSLVLRWEDLSSADPCIRYRIWAADGPRAMDIGAFSLVQDDLVLPQVLVGGEAVMGDGLHLFLVTGAGRIGGPGPFGHYGQ